MSDNQHLNSHTDPNIAYHIEWEFRKEAFIWLDNRPVSINIHPVATELYDWLRRKGHVSLLMQEDKDEPLSITNPYTYDASTLAGITTHIINGGHDFATSEESISDIEAGIECIRLYNEQVLYTARFCEASIKQLLYCTQISKKHYKDASIGTLLSTDCRACRGEGKPHKMSLLGSLAHRYNLCLEFDYCLSEHLKIVNRRRNVEAAHSGTQLLRKTSVNNSKSQLLKDLQEIGNEFVHMLKHISDLETLMILELKRLLMVIMLKI